MRAVESEGATIEQAIERALILLDLPREGVEVEVVQQPTAGATAIVRVTPRGHSRRDVSRETAVVSQGGDGEDAKPENAKPAVLPMEEIKALVAEMLGHMGLMCRVAPPALEEEGGRLRIEISGEDAALVIGRQGQTLDAIELVVNRIVDRQWPGSPQITMDADGYRDRRVRKLIDIAFQEAGKVRRSGRRVDMEPMSPRDRRSVHLALQNEPGVSTHSEGDGSFRHIVIEPTGQVGLFGTRPRFR
jgi:spoIIIJ-associated protein